MPKTGASIMAMAVTLLLSLFAAAGLLIPWGFETTTLWYKTGIDKVMLQGGQYAGMAGLLLLYLQLLLAVRPRQLITLFGAAALVRMHQANGVLLLGVAVLHMVLVLAPEGLANLPIGRRFWPEMIGMALLLVIILTVAAALLKRRFDFSYRYWRIWHRLFGYLAVALVSVHALFVSESFEHPLPRWYLAGSFSGLLIWVIWIKWRQFGKAKRAGKGT